MGAELEVARSFLVERGEGWDSRAARGCKKRGASNTWSPRLGVFQQRERDSIGGKLLGREERPMKNTGNKTMKGVT